jgi:hypothetical protein
MPTLLSDLINAIPVVRRGDVISPESHNSRRDAIVAIVTELGGAVASRNVTLTFAPAFLPVPPEAGAGPPREWLINVGFAQCFQNTAFGWLPLQLPDGSRIQQLHVSFGGSGSGKQFLMNVKLQRQYTDARTTEDLATLSVGPVERLQPFMESKAPFTNDPRVFPRPGREPADIVNNEEFKYFVRAELPLHTNGALPDVVNIFAIRVDCRLG